MSLTDGEAKKIGYGVLNPGVRPSPTSGAPDLAVGGSMRAIKNAAMKAYTPNARSGTGPYRGIVLMKLPEITGEAPEMLPRDSWLSSYFYDTAEGENQEQMPYPLKQFKVYIPELHIDLPRVEKYLPYVNGGGDDPEYKKIGMYPTFIARDSAAEDAEAGDLVWVNFGNNETFEDPYYVGKVFSEPSPQPGDSTCARDAATGSVGGVLGAVANAVRGAVASVFGGNTTGPNPASGEALEFNREYQQLAATNAESVHLQFPNLAYAPLSEQERVCISHPKRSRTIPPQRSFRGSTSANCENCFQTQTPTYPVRSGSDNGRPHMYREHFVRYVERGGRSVSVSGRIGIGCVNHMENYLERILLAQRLVAEDQVGRPYGWGCKHWMHERGGIDCSGFTHLSRSMVELMMSSDSNLNGLQNNRFQGWTGKGFKSEGNNTAADVIPAGSRIDLPWHAVEYGSPALWGEAMKNRGISGRWTRDYFGNGLVGSPMHSAYASYRRGLGRCLVTINNETTDPNIEWGSDSSHAPAMPGDLILMGRRTSITEAKQIPSATSSVTPRRRPHGQPHASTHIVTIFSGPGGLLRTVEASGSSGVKTKLFHEWHSRVRGNYGVFLYETEEMRRAWESCEALCVQHNIPHANGRPLVPWTPDIAKKLAPTLYAQLQPEGWSEQTEAATESVESASAEGSSSEPISSAPVMSGDISEAINPETGEASTEVVRTNPQPTPAPAEDGIQQAVQEATEGTSPAPTTGGNLPEGSTAVHPQPPSESSPSEQPADTTVSSGNTSAQPNTSPPTGQVGTGGPTPAARGGCSAGGSRGAGGRGGSGGSGGGGGGGGHSGGPSTPNPAYQGDGVPLTEPKANKVRIQFDAIRTDFCAGNGGTKASLREDAANDMIGVKRVVNELGGILPNGGTGRGLGNYDPSNTNRSTTSFHYTYLAYDIYTHAGSLYPTSNPDECEFVITYDPEGGYPGNRMWVVWARSDKEPGTEFEGHRVERLTLDARVCPRGTNGQPVVRPTTGNFINLTQLMRAFNFKPIGGRTSYFQNCSRNTMGSEWWHFQYSGNISAGHTWEATMKSIHSDRAFNCSPVAKHRRRVYRNLGFSGRSVDVPWSPC